MRIYYFILRFLRLKFIIILFVLISCVFTLSRWLMLRTNRFQTNSNKSFFKSQLSQKKAIFQPFARHTPPRPITKFIPGQFLKEVTPTDKSYCNFKYGTDSYNWTENMSYSPEMGIEGPYRVIYNIIDVNYNIQNNSHSGVTYCTHATPEFLYHIVEVVLRWDGFVSIAVFIPGTDASLSLLIIRQICQCVPEMSRISLHFVFPAIHPPDFSFSINDNMTTTDGSGKSRFKDCSVHETLLNGSFKTYMHQQNLFYPVNVARNVARMGAKTIYVLVSDVELLPSRNLAPEFLLMVERFKKRHTALHPFFATPESWVKKYVFVLPVFEVEASQIDIPETKDELLNLYSKSRAVYFHRWVCLHCQRFPGLQRWVQRIPGNVPVKPMLIVRREFPYHRWEPIYIGTNSEPFYSELLSWEGQQDKMTQMNEMCLLGYRFVILDGAFLVHTPGMKRRSDLTDSQTLWRKPHQWRNIQIYKSITEEMAKKYRGNSRCRVRN